MVSLLGWGMGARWLEGVASIGLLLLLFSLDHFWFNFPLMGKQFSLLNFSENLTPNDKLVSQAFNTACRAGWGRGREESIYRVAAVQFIFAFNCFNVSPLCIHRYMSVCERQILFISSLKAKKSFCFCPLETSVCCRKWAHLDYSGENRTGILNKLIC